jgi:hypothetical protein
VVSATFDPRTEETVVRLHELFRRWPGPDRDIPDMPATSGELRRTSSAKRATMSSTSFSARSRRPAVVTVLISVGLLLSGLVAVAPPAGAAAVWTITQIPQ